MRSDPHLDGTAGRAFLRHTLATLAYRAGKVLRGAPNDFSGFAAGPSTRTPDRILAHIGDLLDWALSMAQGRQRWNDSQPQAWDEEVARFYTSLQQFDAFLASDAPLAIQSERLFQGPVADALTHVGQLAMLRRLAGAPVHGENFATAAIVTGRVGADQTPPRVEFG